MTEKDISQTVLKTIKDQGISPRPRWQFLLKDYTLFLATAIFVIFGGFTMATIMHTIVMSDWDIYGRIYGSLWKFILLSLPYFWFILFLLFLWLAKYYFQHTDKGYKFGWQILAAVSIFLSLVLGFVFYRLGWGGSVDSLFAKNVPFYEQIINPRARVWQSPERGFLAGVILELGDYQMIVRDLNSKEWLVSLEDADEAGQEIFARLSLGQPVRIVGQALEGDIFYAEIILPMRGLNGLMESHHLMGPMMMPAHHERMLPVPTY